MTLLAQKPVIIRLMNGVVKRCATINLPVWNANRQPSVCFVSSQQSLKPNAVYKSINYHSLIKRLQNFALLYISVADSDVRFQHLFHTGRLLVVHRLYFLLSMWIFVDVSVNITLKKQFKETWYYVCIDHKIAVNKGDFTTFSAEARC